MKRFIWFRLLVLVIAFGLAGCFGSTGLSVDQETAVSCRAYAAAIASVVPFKDQMTKDQIASIDTARKIITPICESASKGGTTTSEQLNSLRASLQILLAVEKGFRQ